MLAGWTSYTTSLVDAEPEFVIGAHHQLWHIDKSFRMSKHDLKARSIYHYKRESIQAHMNIVFAALAVTRLVESATDWSIKHFARTARRDPTVQIKVGEHTITAEDPLPVDLRDALAQINWGTNLARVRSNGENIAKAPRFVMIINGTRTLDGESRAHRLVGLKGYATNIPAAVMPAVEVTACYHDLWRVEQSFRMGNTDLRARPMFHHTPRRDREAT